ncbi:MAG TPA: hypothetical protein VIK18_12435 [Pirellulales bacterium]
MRRVALLAVLGSCLWGQTAMAQLFVSDPYARDPNATLSTWPVLYKLPPSHKAFYYVMGWCGTCKKGTEYQKWYDRHSQFNVNALPEAAWEGRVVSASSGMVDAVDDSGQRTIMVIYPSRGVSDVHVVGPAEPEMLKLGKWVRFAGKIDEAGRVTEKVSQLEFYTPQKHDDMPLVTPGPRQLIAGCLVRKIGGLWEMRPARKCKFNAFEFSLASKPHMTVDVAEVSAVRPGQKLTVRGRLFDVAAQTTAKVMQQGPGWFDDPNGVIEAEQAKVAAVEAEKAVKGATTLVPVIFTCQMIIQTGTDEVAANPQRPAAAPSQLADPGK